MKFYLVEFVLLQRVVIRLNRESNKMKYFALIFVLAVFASEISAQQKCPTIPFAKNFNTKKVSSFVK